MKGLKVRRNRVDLIAPPFVKLGLGRCQLNPLIVAEPTSDIGIPIAGFSARGRTGVPRRGDEPAGLPLPYRLIDHAGAGVKLRGLELKVLTPHGWQVACHFGGTIEPQGRRPKRLPIMLSSKHPRT